MGRVPSASSQMGLFHSDDFNSYWRISAFNTIYRKRINPFSTPKALSSMTMGHIGKVRLTPSAMYAIDDKGGLDNYINRTPPEELRSTTADKLRELSIFKEEHGEVTGWNLPWRVLSRKRDKLDPMFARFKFLLKKEKDHNLSRSIHATYAPYFLPRSDSDFYPERMPFSKSNSTELNFWWKSDKKLEEAFRARLRDAKSYDEAHPDRNIIGSYRKGEGAGGGGGQGSPRPRSKTYKSRQSRPY